MNKVISSRTGLNGEKLKYREINQYLIEQLCLANLAKGDTKITGFLKGDDCMSTISCFKKLGIDIEVNDDNVIVHGKGLNGLNAPKETLDVGNSGTTIRLISGISLLLKALIQLLMVMHLFKKDL